MKSDRLIAAIDVGTNSFHLVIASVNDKGILQIHSRAKEMVRLGSGAGDMKRISTEAIERGVAALKRFATMAQKAKAPIRAIATSAVREALNKDEFLRQAADIAGVRVEVVSGLEEGRLIYVGAIHAVPILSKKALVIDIGGGSTETVVGVKGEHYLINSAKLGSIRLSQRFFATETTTPEQLIECREYICGELASTFQQILQTGFEIAVATSGTAHTLAGMVLAASGKRIPDVINGLHITRDEVLEAIQSLIRAGTSAARAEIPGMEPNRSDIILGGALILEQIIINLNIQRLTLSAYALREGILFDTVQKNEDIRVFHHLSRLRYETIYHLCELYQVNIPHANHVKNLAQSLFDQLLPAILLSDAERELLEAAALLHDVGYHISPDQHHKHSYYIILNCVMPGFTNDEAELIANISRYHRKSNPKKKHLNFTRLPAEKQKIVSILAGILRIAEGLDRRQQQIVNSIQVFKEKDLIHIYIQTNPGVGADIELWGARRRKDLLEQMIGKKIVISVLGE
ncbi:MAG: Ppx/GppA family phosphatase [Ignavibacteria bacterium]|nr:Ppx/GppA family phosphatase [Ignavibacteria bacterium]